jgi:hypothetical protein
VPDISQNCIEAAPISQDLLALKSCVTPFMVIVLDEGTLLLNVDQSVEERYPD